MCTNFKRQISKENFEKCKILSFADVREKKKRPYNGKKFTNGLALEKKRA